MIDIHFYQKMHDVKSKILQGDVIDRSYLLNKMESFRSRDPVVFNIETTNICNMKCVFCPRTTKMTRGNEVLSMDLYKRVVEGIRPWNDSEWGEWKKFCKDRYDVLEDEVSENNFFLYIVPKVVTLHGFGSPLLDKFLPERIRLLTEKNIPSYFSCNAANVNMSNIGEIFKSGLGYLKFSVDSVSDKKHKELRGQCSDFNESYRKIMNILEIIDNNDYKTKVVVTMIDLGLPNQMEDYLRLEELFKNTDVYLYLKSQDVRWYSGSNISTRSIHWSEFCQFPWSSITVTSSGKITLCPQDYNDEIIMGYLYKNSLYNIWNGGKYKRFRRNHFDLEPRMKCSMECDMRLVGEFIL